MRKPRTNPRHDGPPPDGGDGRPEPAEAPSPATRLAPDVNPRDSAIAFTAVAAVLCALAVFGWFQGPPLSAETQEPPPSLRIALNHDSRAALQLLPGIGPALAERVDEARARRPLTDSADLQARVRGIGPVIAERIEPYVTFE